MKSTLGLLAVLTIQLLPASAAAAVGEKPSARRVQTPDAEEKARAQLARSVAELEASLDKIQANKGNQPLFESQDPTIIKIQAEFSWAQKTVHDAVERLGRGESIDTSFADNFHNHLREYRMNVDEMPPGTSFGATEIPDVNTMKKLIADLQSAVDRSNKIAGLQEVSVLGLRPDASAQEPVTFGKRSLTEVYYLLDHRTLTYVTSQGTNAGRDLRSSLDAVWRALEQLVDSNGERVVQVGEKGEVLADQLAPLKAALKEAAKQADFYRRGYLPNAWRDAHRRRAEQIELRLSPDGFQRALQNVKTLKTVPSGKNGSDPARR